MPDELLDVPTSVAAGVVAAAGIAVALRGARRELDDRTAPMAGLVPTSCTAPAGPASPPARDAHRDPRGVDVLGDAELMTRHRLELPYGFDPRHAGRTAPGC